jgi:hypothetical protein
MSRGLLRTLLLLAAAGSAFPQTSISLRSQSRDVDFSAASETKPFRTGTVLPSTCGSGSVFFKTNAIPGQNIYLCTATNTWSQVVANGGGGGGSLPDMSAAADAVLSNDGFNAQWRLLGGDLSGPPQNASVTRVRGVAVAPNTPVEGQGLIYEAANSRWAPRNVVHTLQASTGVICSTSAGLATCRTDDAVVPFYVSGSGAPSYACQTGRDFYTDTSAGALYFCRATNTWQLLARRGISVRTSTDTRTATGLFAGVTPIAANTINAGAVIESEWAGVVTATTGDMTFSLLPKAGTVALADGSITTGILAGSTTLPWRVKTSCVVLTAGAAGAMECTSSFSFSESAGSGATREFLSTSTRAINTTAAADFRLELEAIGGTGTLSATLRHMRVRLD